MNQRLYKILIVDDEDAARYGMRRALGNFGYQLDEAGSVAQARELIKTLAPDLILLDVNLPGESGLDFLAQLHASEAERPPLVIIITAHGSERMAVNAVKAGAYDYLSKPFEVDELRFVVKNALETLQLRRENTVLRRRIEIESQKTDSSLLGTSPAMERVRALIRKVADTDATVLVRGESGTGKELVAQAIHDKGVRRRPGAFVAINCAALPSELIESELFGHEKGAFTGAAARRRGKFEQADGGTLFLDEIGDMSLNVQAKLLRALEERRIERLGGGDSIPVDVRIISATHRNLEEEIAAGNFRADLFYRLRVLTVDIKPLRERVEDIPTLADYFAHQAAERYGLPARSFNPDALRLLTRYEFPGNVRELRNIVERAVVLAEETQLTVYDLPDEVVTRRAATPNDNNDDASQRTSVERNEAFVEDETANSIASDDDGGDPSSETLIVPFTAQFREDRREFEKRYITRCLEASEGNVTRAAVLLGMHRQSLQHKLRELGLARRYVSVEAQD